MTTRERPVIYCERCADGLTHATTIALGVGPLCAEHAESLYGDAPLRPAEVQPATAITRAIVLLLDLDVRDEYRSAAVDALREYDGLLRRERVQEDW